MVFGVFLNSCLEVRECSLQVSQLISDDAPVVVGRRFLREAWKSGVQFPSGLLQPALLRVDLPQPEVGQPVVRADLQSALEGLNSLVHPSGPVVGAAQPVLGLGIGGWPRQRIPSPKGYAPQPLHPPLPGKAEGASIARRGRPALRRQPPPAPPAPLRRRPRPPSRAG